MPLWVEFVAAIVLLLVGVRLSAFFSGAETGFYRLSIPRLNIDATAGDARARRLLWFAQHPAYFVSTCLIGNNIANYVVTAAIGWGVILIFGTSTVALEVAATLFFSPLIFQFGELLPKNVYCYAPLSLLRRDVRWFVYFFRTFFVFSWPLVFLTRVFERFSGQGSQTAELVLGRNRLVQLMRAGHQEGVLTDIQSKLANGLLQLAPQGVQASLTPLPRILGLPETATREELLEFARKYALNAISIHRAGDPDDWYGYVVTGEMIGANRSIPVVHPMPAIPHQSGKLEALHMLQRANASQGVVLSEGRPIGIIARNGLVEQLFRPRSLVGHRGSAR